MSTDSLDRRTLLALLLGTSAGLMSAHGSAEVANSEDNPRFDSSGINSDGNAQLQAIGALGVGHIQSTLGLIGVIADSLSKEIYTPKQIEDLMTGTNNSLESPKRILRKLQDSDVSGDDAEFVDRMISVLNALQREAKALTVYSRTRKPEDAVEFEKKRRQVLKKLGELTQQEEFLETDPRGRRGASQGSSGSNDSND
jgi:hypothetical protein